MESRKFRNRIRILFALHFTFIVVLIICGIMLISASGNALAYEYWSCPIFNVYYTVDWLSLVLGLMLVILGFAGLLAFLLRPKSALILGVDDESRSINASLPSNMQSGVKFFFNPIEHYWPGNSINPVRLQSLTDDSEYGNDKGCKCGWIRPSAFILALIIIGQIVALILATNFISQLSDPSGDLRDRIKNLFVELKADVSNAQPVNIRAKECWASVQESESCCGNDSYMDWLPTNMNATGQAQNATAIVEALSRNLHESCKCSLQLPKVDVSKCVYLNAQNQAVPFNDPSKVIGILKTGCAGALGNRLSGHLYALKVVLPLSIVFTVVTFLTAAIYTLRMAQITINEADYDAAHRQVPTQQQSSHITAAWPTPLDVAPPAYEQRY